MFLSHIIREKSPIFCGTLWVFSYFEFHQHLPLCIRNMTLKNDHRHKSHEWPIFSNHGGSYKTAPQQSRKMPAPRTSYPAAFSSSHCQCSSLLWFDARTPLPPLWCRHISEIPRINDVKPKWPSMNQNYPNYPSKELGQNPLVSWRDCSKRSRTPTTG